MAGNAQTEGPPPPGAWPLVGYAAVAIAAHLALVLATPPNPVRATLGLAVSLASGYCALSLLARASRLSRGEILAFSTGLGILLTSGAALLLAAVRLPVGDHAALLPGIPLATAAAAWRRPWTISPREPLRALRRAFAFPGYSRQERWAARVLYAAVVAALLILIAVATVPYPDRLSPALTLAGPDGSPATLPASLLRNQSQELVISVLGGSATQAFGLRLRLSPQNETGAESFHPISWAPTLRLDPLGEATVNVSVPARGLWSERLSVSLDASGPWDVRFDLLDAGVVTASVRLSVLVIG